MGAKEHQAGEAGRQSHHTQGGIHRESLFFQGKSRPGDPLLVSRGGAGVEVVLPAEDIDERVQRVGGQTRLCRRLDQGGFQFSLRAQGALPQAFDKRGCHTRAS